VRRGGGRGEGLTLDILELGVDGRHCWMRCAAMRAVRGLVFLLFGFEKGLYCSLVDLTEELLSGM